MSIHNEVALPINGPLDGEKNHHLLQICREKNIIIKTGNEKKKKNTTSVPEKRKRAIRPNARKTWILFLPPETDLESFLQDPWIQKKNVSELVYGSGPLVVKLVKKELNVDESEIIRTNYCHNLRHESINLDRGTNIARKDSQTTVNIEDDDDEKHDQQHSMLNSQHEKDSQNTSQNTMDTPNEIDSFFELERGKKSFVFLRVPQRIRIGSFPTKDLFNSIFPWIRKITVSLEVWAKQNSDYNLTHCSLTGGPKFGQEFNEDHTKQKRKCLEEEEKKTEENIDQTISKKIKTTMLSQVPTQTARVSESEEANKEKLLKHQIKRKLEEKENSQERSNSNNSERLFEGFDSQSELNYDPMRKEHEAEDDSTLKKQERMLNEANESESYPYLPEDKPLPLTHSSDGEFQNFRVFMRSRSIKELIMYFVDRNYNSYSEIMLEFAEETEWLEFCEKNEAELRTVWETNESEINQIIQEKKKRHHQETETVSDKDVVLSDDSLQQNLLLPTSSSKQNIFPPIQEPFHTVLETDNRPTDSVIKEPLERLLETKDLLSEETSSINEDRTDQFREEQSCDETKGSEEIELKPKDIGIHVSKEEEEEEDELEDLESPKETDFSPQNIPFSECHRESLKSLSEGINPTSSFQFADAANKKRIDDLIRFPSQTMTHSENIDPLIPSKNEEAVTNTLLTEPCSQRFVDEVPNKSEPICRTFSEDFVSSQGTQESIPPISRNVETSQEKLTYNQHVTDIASYQRKRGRPSKGNEIHRLIHQLPTLRVITRSRSKVKDQTSQSENSMNH
jgi:hypothetical protein